MRAMVMERVVDLAREDDPLRLVELPDPIPGPNDVILEVSCCGVCHTELDEIEGRTAPVELPRVLGHEVVGRVIERGSAARRHAIGARLGVGWIHASDGSPAENVAEAFEATGRDADGGYAERLRVPERYAFPIPAQLEDIEAAPLLCAGAIGHRALSLCALRDGDPLGLMGFGGSAHLVIQLARHVFPRSDVYVFARDTTGRDLAESLGARWTGPPDARAPVPLAAIIDTTPAWGPVLRALENLRPGGRLVINAIRKEDGDREALGSLSYQEHLWHEREIKTVANITGHDIAAFLPIAGEIPIRPTVEVYPLEAANRALVDLKRRPVRGAKVLTIGSR